MAGEGGEGKGKRKGHLCWESQAVGRTLEMAFSVMSTCLVMGGRWRMAPRQSCQATLQVGRVWGQPWQLPGRVVFTWLSLLALWNSPAALDKREQNKLSPPPAPCLPPPHTQSPLSAAPVCSHKTCPAHSQALRPAEGINPVVPCAPAWGFSQALVSCQGVKKETALCWHLPPGSFGS